MSQKQIAKRERGANYTPEEKAMLADLVTKYKNVIEDKRTGGQILIKKKEAWKAITLHYNSNCTTGPRIIEQLKALYDNLKQKLRKNAGEKNKLEYINKNQPNEDFVSEDDLSRALKNFKEDKVQLHKTGGGAWTPKITDTDAKVLAIIQEQIKPLANPYDSGAAYFKDHDYHKICDKSGSEIVDLDVPIIQVPAPQENELNLHIIKETDILMQPSTSLGDSQEMEITLIDQNIQKSEQIITSTPIKKVTPAFRKIVKHKKAVTKIKPQSAEAMKRIYFKKKCENANLEKRKLMQEILQSKQIHNLKMALLKKKLNNNV